MKFEDRADWTADKVAELRQLWLDGLSTAQIGRAMGVSKNAVVGKAHRVGLERESPIKPKREGPANPRKRVRAPAITLAFAPPKPEPAPRYSYRGNCCFPFGTPRTPSFRFCDKPALQGRPYCLACCKVAYFDFRVKQYD